MLVAAACRDMSWNFPPRLPRKPSATCCNIPHEMPRHSATCQGIVWHVTTCRGISPGGPMTSRGMPRCVPRHVTKNITMYIVRFGHEDCRTQLKFFFFLHPIYYPRTPLELPPSSSSAPGSHSGPSPPPSYYGTCLHFLSRGAQHFLPSPTRVELCVPTLLGPLSSSSLFSPGMFLHFFQQI